jgi:hypothetical protein
MALIDHLQCGRVIVFNSMLFKLRWAFCINYSADVQIIYRGFFGLRAIDKKTFLGFARIVDVFDYIDRPLTDAEKFKLKTAHKTGIMKTCDNVEQYVDKLFKKAEIKLFVNPEGWIHEDITK